MLEKMEGAVERITYYSEEDGYTVARFQPEGRSDLVTVVGNLMSVNVGESAWRASGPPILSTAASSR